MTRRRKIRVLLIEDEEFDVIRVQKTITYVENQIEISDVVSDGSAALALLKDNSDAFDVIIMDYQIAGGIMGEALIRRIKEINSCLQIIVITKMTLNIADFEFANRLLEAGAFWYCTKYPTHFPEMIYQPTDFILSIQNACDKKELERDKLELNRKFLKNVEDILNQKKIIGSSKVTDELRKQIIKFASSDINVLITGDSGTGKELVAYNIHYNSIRKFENFIPINCGSLPNDLIESELFGYEKGAFTGATNTKQGLFEIANKGTVFLDEVSELPITAQVKLLRVIQEGEIEKIGRNRNIKVDVRIVAATNKDLLKEVEEKRFRKDLYYRLNILPIYVPPLKDRMEDIQDLLEYFMNAFCRSINKEVPVLSEDARKQLLYYDWPGNIRELKNAVQRMLIYDESVISSSTVKFALGTMPEYLPDRKNNPDSVDYLFDENAVMPLKNAEKIFREKYIHFVRNISASDADASLKLGIAPSNYFRLGKQLGYK